jgi:hypothetical protein
MAYSRNAGSWEGAVLVFHHTAKEARKMAWDKGPIDYEDWLDVAVKWLKRPHIHLLSNQKKLTDGTPHLVDSPASCEACGIWGQIVHSNYECSYCGEYVGEKLAQIWKPFICTDANYYTIIGDYVLNKQRVDSSDES